MTAKQYSRPPARAALVKSVVAALDDMKAGNVKVMDVRKVTDMTDCMVVASGNSDRHVRSIADRVVERTKEAGFRPMGVEGQRDAEWVLVDLNDVIVHVMLPRVREFYALEQLWEVRPITPRRAIKNKKKKPLRPAPPARKSTARRAATGARKFKSKAKAKKTVAKKAARKTSSRTRG
jgi:ribosome silencing factor RsfS/YbeB/iojap